MHCCTNCVYIHTNICNEEGLLFLMSCLGKLFNFCFLEIRFHLSTAMLLAYQIWLFHASFPMQYSISPSVSFFSLPTIPDFLSTVSLRCIEYQNLVQVSIQQITSLFFQNGVVRAKESQVHVSRNSILSTSGFNQKVCEQFFILDKKIIGILCFKTPHLQKRKLVLVSTET